MRSYNTILVYVHFSRSVQLKTESTRSGTPICALLRLSEVSRNVALETNVRLMDNGPFKIDRRA